MTKIDTMLEDIKFKIKQSEEAKSLLDRIGGDVMWACDFCKVNEITEALEEIQSVISDAEDRVDHIQNTLEEELEHYEKKIARFEEELTA